MNKVRQKIVTWIEFEIEVPETETLENLIKTDPDLTSVENMELSCDFHAEEVLITEIYPESGGEYPIFVIDKNDQNSGIITVEKLKLMKHGDIFASGITINSPEGVYVSDSYKGHKLRWVAVKGGGNDWAIYVGLFPEHVSDYETAINGDKINNLENIKKLVNCTEAVLNLYRH